MFDVKLEHACGGRACDGPSSTALPGAYLSCLWARSEVLLSPVASSSQGQHIETDNQNMQSTLKGQGPARGSEPGWNTVAQFLMFNLLL